MQEDRKKEYECWIEITANKEYLLDVAKFRDAMEHCKKAGMTAMILSVKDTTGFVLYPSVFAPHYSEFDSDFEETVDYVERCFSVIRSCGMKCYAAFDVFAEGNKKQQHPKMKGLCKDGFECEVYGIDSVGNTIICKSTQAENLITVGSIDDFGEIFVNPGNMEVCDYECSLIREFAQKYHPDGIVLDRVRYVGLSTDFSEMSRKQWEAYSGITDEKWPEDIYRIEKCQDGWKEKPGRYFGEFVTYRMQVIHDFVKKISDMLHADFPSICFMDYTGSWYPLYYQVGANWADQQYEVQDFPWCNREKLMQTGYAQLVDVLLSGCYYEQLSILEAREAYKPADWYSVEGAGALAKRVTCQKEGLVDSLFLEQYHDQPQKISQAIQMCIQQSEGCMLFDLSYLISNNWWKYARMVYDTPLQEQHLNQMLNICCSVFPEWYHVTETKLKKNLLYDSQFDAKSSICLWDCSKDSLIGFAGVKISENQDLYPNTAWISIFAIAPEWQNLGFGTLMLQKVLQQLRSNGIKKVFLGQDFANFFSGIPDPDKKKMEFFERQGFCLNMDEHYDLEADIINNVSIDNFNTKPWETYLSTATYQGEEDQLLFFLHEEFAGRWEYEAKAAINEHKNPEEIILLWNKDKTQVKGYCMLHAERDSSGNLTGYGGLGPIGISKKIRGHHVGDFLLHQSLCQLRKIGVKRVNIDWTILKEFYGQFDFVPVRTYRAASLSMPQETLPDIEKRGRNSEKENCVDSIG